MLKKRMADDVAWSDTTQVCRFIVQILGILLCGLLSTSVAASDVQGLPSTYSATADGLVQRIQVRNDVNKRRDPFRPIKKRRSISTSSRKAQAEPPTIAPIPTIQNPNWKLLGIIHGQYGRQAVIQVSPQERVFVRAGLEVLRSGWIIKTIKREEVLLEHSSFLTSGKAIPQPKAFILSFPTLGKTS